MALPTVILKADCLGFWAACFLSRRVARETLMHASRVVVVFERLQFVLQVVCGPKEQTIQILAAQGGDEPLNKWMRPGNPGHRLHSFHVQDPQIGLPTVKLEQRIVIGTKLLGQSVARDGLVEHAAEPWTIECNGLHTKANDSTGKLINDH